MKTTRRFAVASLLVIAVAVVLGAPAPASAGKRTSYLTYVKLYPAADSSFPRATGTLSLSIHPSGFGYDMVGVSVSRLAPSASYYMQLAFRYRDYWGVWHDQVYNVPIQTDARGNGVGGFGRSSPLGPNDFLITSPLFQVYDPSGTLVLTPYR